MVMKTIVLLVPSSANNNGNGDKTTKTTTFNNYRRTYWKISSQAALQRLLTRYQVDGLVQCDDDCACHVTHYAALMEGCLYSLGESAAMTVELQEFKSNNVVSSNSSSSNDENRTRNC